MNLCGCSERLNVILIGVAACVLLAQCGVQPRGDTDDNGGINPPSEPADAVGIDETDDVTDPGDPAAKRSYVEGLTHGQGPSDHFEFNEQDHWVRSVSLHGTELSVAIDRTVLENDRGLSAEAFADFVESAFHTSWHVFGGYAFDRYAVRVRADDGNGDFSLSAVGVTFGGVDYGMPWFYEGVAHEMFHSWNGKFIQYVPNGSNDLFQWETWLVEGGTVYYAFRHMAFALNLSEFEGGMGYRLETYLGLRGGPYDLSIAEVAAAASSAPPGDPSTQDPTNMLYARGALVSYLLDRELHDRGTSLNELLRQLYLDALDGRRWTRASLVEILLDLTGEDFDPFLTEWLDTNAILPLDGSFELLD